MHSEWEKGRRNLANWVYQCLTNNTNKWNAVLSLFKILSLSISRFETRTRILFSKSRISRRERDFFYQYLRVRDENEIFLSISQGSRRERDFFYQYLRVRDENEIFLSISQGSRRDRDIFFQVSCFEMGLRDEINLILMRIFEIEKSRHALS